MTLNFYKKHIENFRRKKQAVRMRDFVSVTRPAHCSKPIPEKFEMVAPCSKTLGFPDFISQPPATNAETDVHPV
jgi:hypothetical protein